MYICNKMKPLVILYTTKNSGGETFMVWPANVNSRKKHLQFRHFVTILNTASAGAYAVKIYLNALSL